MEKDLGTTSIGLKANVAALLCYSLGIISGVILFLIEKENKFVRFHALQSIIVFGAIFILQVILPVVPFVGWALIPIAGLAGLVLWILLMIKAYQGELFKLPVVGDIAEQKS